MKAQRTWRREAAKLSMEPSIDLSSNPYPGEDEPLRDEFHGGHWQMASDFLPGIAMPPPGSGVSKYRGVSWHKRNRKWRATCRDRTAKKSLHLGYFPTEKAAARAYDREAIRIRGPSTRLNFKGSDYGVKADPCGAHWLQQRRNCTNLGAAQCVNASKTSTGTKKTRKRTSSSSVPAASMPMSGSKSKKGRTTNAACSAALLTLTTRDIIAPPEGQTAESEVPKSKDSRTPTNEGGCAMQLCHAECPDRPLGCTTPTRRRSCCRGAGQRRALF
ncbi:g1270 [Coccomyxa elongata]